MNQIQCRPPGSKKGIKNTVEKFECSLTKGMVCNGKCSDYEIRVRCKCQKEISKY